MNRFYLLVAVRAGRVCEYCQAPERFSNFAFEVEHIVPPLAGGANEFENLALSCRSCNVFKSNFLTGIDESGYETQRLFNPRIDEWTEHFELNPQTLEISALSEVGRGTILRLRFNSEKQRQARILWQRAEDVFE